MSAQPKHTPGPWVAHVSNAERASYRIYGPGYNSIGDVFEQYGDHCPTPGAHCANAALIASAPELLEALRDVLDTRNAEAKAATAYQVAFENFGDARPEAVAHERAMRAASAAEAKARVVIAKATGSDA
jgi:hypothetical protein